MNMETSSGHTTPRTIPLTLDIWDEVLRYLRCDVRPGSKIIGNKRMDILSVALLSPLLTSRALDALWEGMTSLVPLATVINSFASSEDGLYLAEVEDDANGDGTGRYWELRRPIEDDTLRHRVHEYLSRVQTFRVDGLYTSGTHLWPILGVCFGSNSPLLPNLRHLILYWGEAPIRSIPGQTLLLSPTLTTLEITQKSQTVDGVLPVLRLIKSRRCKLKRFEYSGISTPDLLLTLMTFKNLKRLRIFDHRTHDLRQESSIPPSAVLEYFASETQLHINLRVFLDRQTMISFPVHHPTLETLNIKGGAENLQDFLNQVSSSTLHTLELEIDDEDGLSWKALCGQAVLSFPHIRSFSLVSPTAGDGPPLLAGDFSALLSKPLAGLCLRDIPHRWTTDDLTAMLKMLPRLHALSIDYFLGQPPDEVAFDASILTTLSQQSHLSYLDLCLDFSTLLTLLPDTGFSSRSMVEKISIYYPKNFPSTLKEKLVLAQNLLMLFPRLRVIEHDETKNEITDLQECIVALNRRVASYCFSR